MIARSTQSRRIFFLGGTGTIGRATVRALVRRGHEVISFVRACDDEKLLAGSLVRVGRVTDSLSLAADGFRGERFDSVVSCLASRNGAPKDAWAIDYQAHVNVLEAAHAGGVKHVILLSAICVQKPVLAFQLAKLAFEKVLIDSGMSYTIVRPTAFFKSLSGQIDRVKAGKPFLVFGDGRLTACKPISDNDLAHYITDCVEDETRTNRVLPIGGPGEAITPRQQGEHLFALLKREPRFRQVPIALLDGIIGALSALGHVSPKLSDKAELARIGRYYATESMLVLDPATGRYEAALTPSTGIETLFDFYRDVLNGTRAAERRDHAVF